MPLKQLPGLRPDTQWPLLGVNWSFQDNRKTFFGFTEAMIPRADSYKARIAGTSVLLSQ
jgi:hypothetical protein